MSSAISIRPELAYAMMHFDRACEAREFPAEGMIGRDLYLHAGKHLGGRPGRPAAMRGFKRLADSMYRAGFAAIPLHDHLNDPAIAVWEIGDDHGKLLRMEDFPTGVIFAVARLAACTEQTSNPWREDGPWHWIFSDVRVLAQPIACNGAQGIWVVPREIEAALAAQVGGTRPALDE